MASKYDALSRIILQNVGGKANINAVTHCITRLRFNLQDEAKANTDVLTSTDGIVTVMQSGGQYQVVIGNHVPDVFKSVVAVGHLEDLAASQSDDGSAPAKMNPFDTFVNIVTSVFTPFLGVLCACGILKGLLALCTTFNILGSSGGTYNILFSLADSGFYFLPPILGYTAAKRFKLLEIEGLVIGLAMVYPFMLDAKAMDLSNLFGIPVVMPPSGNYTSSVIPVICAVAFAGWFENKIKPHIHDAIKLFAVPLITLTVTFALTILAIGPVASAISSGLSFAFNWLYSVSPVVMCAIVGAFWPVLVIFGMHWSLVPIAMINMTQGGDIILAAMIGTTFANSGSVAAIWLKTKDKKIKGLSPAAFISAVAGVTEPAIYGILLPKKTPFIRDCIISGIGGAVLGFLGVKVYQMAGLGVFAYTGFIDTVNNDVSGMTIAIIVSLLCGAAGFLVELLFYREKAEAAPAKKPVAAGEAKNVTVHAPITGKYIALAELPDEVFSQGFLGQGCGVEPEDNHVYAPIDGEIVQIAETKHAVGIQSPEGAEVLIHVGMDTVNMQGYGFDVKVKLGDKVRAGDMLMTFDAEKIKAAGYPITTAIVITNSDEFTEIAFDTGKSYSKADEIGSIH
ncbi:MAG: PTS glucose transporter subunit IIA [Synergistaceae bacterium]|nr:PTS glucose transporter subunit IIA [Synergistaceae bacterium]